MVWPFLCEATRLVKLLVTSDTFTLADYIVCTVDHINVNCHISCFKPQFVCHWLTTNNVVVVADKKSV